MFKPYVFFSGVLLEKLMDNLDISKINNGDDRCSVLNAGSLISVECSEMYPYMCYKQENSEVQLTSCGTTDKGKVNFWKYNI